MTKKRLQLSPGFWLTRDGRKVEVIGKNNSGWWVGYFSSIGDLLSQSNPMALMLWKDDGGVPGLREDHPDSIIRAFPMLRPVWVSIYQKEGSGKLWGNVSFEEVKTNGIPGVKLLAVKKVSWIEGEFEW